ncbi:uncharacterized protein [Rutidosis leptorrhynchoides]|uniref:uncharacterized protein n=1 Tax=Rutidosis leptorrhynchoides TaxID=125765 RepID=UPI003A9A1017
MEDIILIILLCSSFCTYAQISDEALDVILHEHTLKTLLSHKQKHGTGTLYDVTLPANLSGIHVSYVRLRSKTLWNKGANFSSFQIPSRTLPVPYVKRIVIMFQDFGNLSSKFYNRKVPGYTLMSSVMGFKVYDASNPIATSVKHLDFNISDHAPILVHFRGLKFSPGAKCAYFGGSNGEVLLSDMNVGNVCYARSYGRFSVVMPNRKKGRVWIRWGIGAAFLTILVCFIGLMVMKMKKVKKLDEMVMQMENGSEELETVWIGYNKMPCATRTRTPPNLENAGVST